MKQIARWFAVILFTGNLILLSSGCALPRIGKASMGGILQTPIAEFDLPELAANLGPDQAMLVQVDYESYQPDQDITKTADSTLTVGTAMSLVKAGAGLTGEDTVESVAKSAIEKNRRIATTVIIANSDDVRKMRESDNEHRLVPGMKLEDVSVSMVATAGYEFVTNDPMPPASKPGDGDFLPPPPPSSEVDDTPVPSPGTPPSPGPADSVFVDGEWIPKPDDSNARLGEGTPGWMERNQPLWKAKSERGSLVILLPMMQRPKEAIIFVLNPSDHASIQKLASSRQITRSGHNGNRAHIRFPNPGSNYARSGLATVLKIYMQDGTTLWYDVPKPSARHQMPVGKHQDAGRQWKG